MDVKSKIQSVRNSLTQVGMPNVFDDISDKSYVIDGEISHDIDEILWPGKGDQFPIEKSETFIYKVTDKNILDWFKYCLENEIDSTIVALTLDGAKVTGIKKAIEDVIKPMEHGDTKDTFMDVISIMDDFGKLGFNLNANSGSVTSNVINFFSENERFTYLNNILTLQSTLGPTNDVIKTIKKYIEKNKLDVLLKIYAMCAEWPNKVIVVGDTETETLYFIRYVDLGFLD